MWAMSLLNACRLNRLWSLLLFFFNFNTFPLGPVNHVVWMHHKQAHIRNIKILRTIIAADVCVVRASSFSSVCVFIQINILSHTHTKQTHSWWLLSSLNARRACPAQTDQLWKSLRVWSSMQWGHILTRPCRCVRKILKPHLLASRVNKHIRAWIYVLQTSIYFKRKPTDYEIR
jgi:hypothetical protein